MVTAIARLVQPQESVRVAQRGAQRVIAQRRGLINSAHGESALVLIGDASSHGCSIQCASGSLRPGRFVSIGFEDGTPLQAIVRWVREDRAGLDFLHAVPAHLDVWQTLIALDN
ncbi:MAG: PilZ domain-containing protein [Novosphingobium sp.]